MSEDANERSAALQRLDSLVGKWNVELVFPSDPPFRAETEASFEWLDANQRFLVYRAGTEGSGYPVGHCIIGLDDTMDTYTMLYTDSRGVSRIYQMGMTDTEMRQWRDAPEFKQRLSLTFSEDRRTLKGAWEIAEDGVNWKHDFDITYTRAD